MRKLFVSLAIGCFALVEVFMLWASFRHGFFTGIGKYLVAHINPLIVIYYLPAIFLLWLSSKFK